MFASGELTCTGASSGWSFTEMENDASRCSSAWLLSMAGLFNYWSKGRPMLTFKVITTTPNQWMARIHNRTPAILQDDQIEQWLDPTASDPLQLAELLKARFPRLLSSIERDEFRAGRQSIFCGQD